MTDPQITEPVDEVETNERDEQDLRSLLVDEVLVEDVSIDGMCGVY